MKILLSWLNDYIETNLTAEQIAEILSNLGFPCESIVPLAGDAVIDIEVTSNRGDCLGLLGIGRELAAATGKPLKTPVVELAELDTEASRFASVEIAEPDLCWRYTGRIIDGVKVGPSPDWLKNRLEAVGIRSVNNVVDATNYAMLETGQPPHAFDYEKIAGGKIIVRKALPGERIVSIDGSMCDLSPDMLIIADAEKPVAIAGVMGGLDSEVSDTTSRILLEDAYFDPVTVRRTSRRLALPSEAAFRFERIVDVEMIDAASRRTAQLITQVAGGRVAKGVVDVYPRKPASKEVTLRISRLNKLLGIEIAAKEVVRILSALSFAPKLKGDSVVCSVPSWRSDVYREADLIEEVARVHGYNKIPTQPKIEIKVAPVDAHEKLAASVGCYLNACGFYETINVGFIADDIAQLFAADDVAEHLAVKDISKKGENLLRSTLIGSLLAVLKTNVNAKNTPCSVFEIANTVVPAKGDAVLPIEKTKVALVCDGDFRQLRGVIDGLIKSINGDSDTVFVPAELVWAEAGAEIKVDGQTVGTAGVVCRKVKEKFDFDGLRPCAAELDFETLAAVQVAVTKVKPIPRFPAIERDLSIIVDEQISWADIIEAVNSKACSELEDVRFVGVYRSKGIPQGKKSVTLSLRFRDEDGTLTHETVNGFEKTIVQSLTKSTAAELRTV